MNKPLILEIEEARIEIVASVNNALQNHGLPCYLIEPILSELLTQIREGARNELDAAKSQMQNNSSKEE